MHYFTERVFINSIHFYYRKEGPEGDSYQSKVSSSYAVSSDMELQVALLEKKLEEKEAIRELQKAKEKLISWISCSTRECCPRSKQLDVMTGIRKSRGVRWSTDVVAKAVVLRCLSKKALSFVTEAMQFLCRPSALSRRTHSFKVDQVCLKVYEFINKLWRCMNKSNYCPIKSALCFMS